MLRNQNWVHCDTNYGDDKAKNEIADGEKVHQLGINIDNKQESKQKWAS